MALRTRDVYPGSEFFPFQIRIKEFKYRILTQKIGSKHSKMRSRAVHPGSRSRIQIFNPSWGQKSTGSRIRICNTEFYLYFPDPYLTRSYAQKLRLHIKILFYSEEISYSLNILSRDFHSISNTVIAPPRTVSLKF